MSEEGIYRLERSYGGFEPTFALPPGVSEDDITAGVAYGVLKVTIPKPAAPEPSSRSTPAAEPPQARASAGRMPEQTDCETNPTRPLNRTVAAAYLSGWHWSPDLSLGEHRGSDLSGSG